MIKFHRNGIQKHEYQKETVLWKEVKRQQYEPKTMFTIVFFCCYNGRTIAYQMAARTSLNAIYYGDEC